MDFNFLLKYANVILREVWKHKFLCLFGFAVVSFIVLIVGILWPSKFQTSATIFADNQNILKPLLEDQAAQSKIQDQTKIVRDKMYSPRILKEVAEIVYGVDSYETAEQQAGKINQIRSKLRVKKLGSGFIKVSYSDETSHEAYQVINAVIDVFIKASSEEQRSESQEAFRFIDNQVKQYKEQLVLAEARLKEFRARNFDGRDIDVNSSISRLRAQIEELKISIDEDETKIGILEGQLANEAEFSSKKIKADVYQERLKVLEERMAALLLSYTEDYPDVVSLKYQIEDIRSAIKESNESKAANDQSDHEVVANPLYQELRSRLSVAQTDIKAKQQRSEALEVLMAQEFERRKRIAERGAEEAELTRDYTVTKRIYEDMLERKEKARLSMTLNVEGQGVTYRVQEPALPPLSPVGLRTLHFVVLGPIAGLLFVLGIVTVFILLDPRIRFPEMLVNTGVPVLAAIPHVNTKFSTRIARIDIIVCIFVGLLIMAAYAGLAFASKVGWI